MHLCIHSFWSGETFKLCQTLWRGTTNKDLEGLEKLAEAVSLVPCYDLMDAPTSIVEHDTTSWKSIVYDYRWMNEQDINHLGLPPKTYVMIFFFLYRVSKSFLYVEWVILSSLMFTNLVSLCPLCTSGSLISLKSFSSKKN